MMAPPGFARQPAAGILGGATFLLIGWIGLLIPTLIRSIEASFGQTDAGIGVYYLVFAVSYAGGSLAGGLATERLGRRSVLTGAAALMAVGLLLLALAPSWLMFVLAAVPTGIGIGGLDGGMNGLFLDLFVANRGRALNLLHLCYSLGALLAPLAVGRLIDGGLAWPPIVLVTAGVALLVAGLFATVAMPTGRHKGVVAAVEAGGPRRTSRISLPLVLLALAICAAVASETGVSNWLVRFLEAAPLSVATGGLTLFWVGLVAGRLVSSRLADRFDHLQFAAAATALSGIACLGAVLVPWQPVSIALFALTGFGAGPVYPMIMVVAGERYPGRSAAVSGSLGSAALAGTIVYPPVMGFLSVTVGLGIAMAGNAILAGLSGLALALVGRARPEPEPSEGLLARSA